MRIAGRCHYVLVSFLVALAAARRFRAAADDNRRSGNWERDGGGRRQRRNRSRRACCHRGCLFFTGSALKEMGQLRNFGSDNALGGPQLLPVFAVRMLAKRPALLNERNTPAISEKRNRRIRGQIELIGSFFCVCV